MVAYGQFCPVAKTSELLCERWMTLVLRELMCGSRRFSEIQRGVPLISPALLSKRLKQLEAAGVIDRTPTGHGSDHVLTEAGWELYPIIEAMGVWGQRWARSRYGLDELDPSLLMWDMRRMLQPTGLRPSSSPPARTVIEIRFRQAPVGKSAYWLFTIGILGSGLLGIPTLAGSAAYALAETFDMTGGYIKNAIVRAAVIAARDRRTMTVDDLWTGAHHEYTEMGKVLSTHTRT